jgi:hypothetical protein
LEFSFEFIESPAFNDTTAPADDDFPAAIEISPATVQPSPLPMDTDPEEKLEADPEEIDISPLCPVLGNVCIEMSDAPFK